MMCTNSSIYSGQAIVKSKKLISTHNPPPAEANTKEREELAGDTPDPVRGASPPAPPLYEWISAKSLTSTHNFSDGPAARFEEEGGCEDYLSPRQGPSRSGKGLRPLHP